ncbi:MAG TPA: HEAT repeat domain-containing protein [Bacteroidota bacterium]|nr:HEAT repeat domain-containing protein [Bacteroidota bacterium]
MKKPIPDGRVEEWLEELASEDGAQRQRARGALVKLGPAIIPHLAGHLEDNRERLRWEIAKTLEELGHPSAATALVGLLMDDVPGIRWLAGEGLVRLKQEALVPLLRGLQTNFHSTFFREGAHHVLRALEREGMLNEKSLDALKALEGAAPSVSVPFAAAEALHSLIES